MTVCIARLLQLLGIFAALKTLEIAVVSVPDRQLQPFGQRVDDRSADTVQTARDLISAAAELAAGMQNGINNSSSRDTLLRMISPSNSWNIS